MLTYKWLFVWILFHIYKQMIICMNIISCSQTNEYLYEYYFIFTYKYLFVWILFHVKYKWIFVWILFHVHKQMIICMNIISCSQTNTYFYKYYFMLKPNEYLYEYYYMLTYKWIFVWILFLVHKQMIICINIISFSHTNEYVFE